MAGYLAALIAWSLTQTVASEPLSPAAHIGVFQQCLDKVLALPEADVSAATPGSPCEDLDADRLKELGVDSCSSVRKALGFITLTFHCAETGIADVKEACADKIVSADCSTKVGESVSKWGPPDAFQPFGELTADGTEQALAVADKCQDTGKEAVDGLKDDGVFDTWCTSVGSVEEDTLKTMGVSLDNCKKQTGKLFGAQMVFMCVQSHDVEPDATADKLQEHVKESVKQLVEEAHKKDSDLQDRVDKIMSEAQAEPERLRLYQAVAKGWPTKAQGVSTKSVVVPGAAMATMMIAAAFTWGFRRRQVNTVDLGDEMLEHSNSEECPE